MEFIDHATGSIENYCAAVEATLNYWLDVHTDPDTWANEWGEGGMVTWAFRTNEGRLENKYFDFDWAAAALLVDAERSVNDYAMCPLCGYLDDAHNVSDTCEACECEVDEWETPDAARVVEFLKDIGVEPTEYALRASLTRYGFPAYREAIQQVTGVIEDNVRETLKRIEDAPTPADRLAAVLYGTRIWHANGELVRDYANMVSDLEDSDVETVRDDGLEAFFSMEDLAEFLEA